jgi:polyhydroxyalkanoate synthesis regulator phasin
VNTSAETASKIQEFERQIADVTKERDEAVQTFQGLQTDRQSQLDELEKHVADLKEQVATLEKARDEYE